MPRKRDLSIRLDAELRDALDQAVRESGDTITSIVEAALAQFLGGEQGPRLVARSGELVQRVDNLEERVARLEGNAVQRNAMHGNTDPPSPPTPKPQKKAHTLTAAQAYALAKDRGWRGTQAQFIGWARAHPDGLRESFGLKMADRYTFVDLGAPDLSVASPQKPQEKTPPPTEGRQGLPIGDALIEAGAPIEPSLCRGNNRSRDMRAATGLGAAEWLQAHGWVKAGKDRWHRRQGL